VASRWIDQTCRRHGHRQCDADSFSDGGRYSSTTQAIEHGLTLATEEPTFLTSAANRPRPGAESVLLYEELKRVVR
jgi:dihydropteroate synthase